MGDRKKDNETEKRDRQMGREKINVLALLLWQTLLWEASPMAPSPISHSPLPTVL